MFPMLKSTGGGHSGAKYGEEWMPDASQILTKSERDMRLPYAYEIVSIFSAV